MALPVRSAPEPTPVQAVIFDLDGVLIDSEQVWDEVRRAFVAERQGRWEVDSTARMMGMSTAEWSAYLVELGAGDSAEEIAAEVRSRVAARYGDAPPLLPGATEAVRALAARWPLGLASSSPRLLIDLVLERSGLAARFRQTVSSEEVARGKPAPDVYLEAVRRLGVPVASAVAVEDSANGLRAAAAAGLAVVAVPNEHFPPGADALDLASARVARVADLTPDVVLAAHRSRPRRG
ncbi:haloacid dehalogenase superfamily protein, subfamily IA, variant 3 with third motif having DD or ED [Frankia sp. EI5c]|uniref:HAD family hydrolase n=1 Tax=Frankia sp. EI5c TaxID=683316 RepID=UPI0007C405CF|nr:HAD family phosphatase [Frankia sp. EI5c]OAA28253.1 haloacid dehalogenase superfamily protein, subfamily IA, variant 3 with third motif having DD or ED [Frankia sp. EI5c]